MNEKQLKSMLEKIATRELEPEDVLRSLKQAPFKDIDFAKLDLHRGIRKGVTEVIYGEGKTKEQILQIIETMTDNQLKSILITRLSSEKALFLQDNLTIKFRYDEISRVGVVGDMKTPDGIGKILIATGGTSDMYVAEEAALTAEFLGNEVLRLYDVGVAGIHRMMHYLDDIMDATVIIAVAGMEGALASVIGGIADAPVIAVPTSVGYGANFGGLSALLSMLNSCASGVSVMNIDNGFGAGYQASLINHIQDKYRGEIQK